ncbi:MAG TPA: hypothetical protein VF807_02830 [Ktedonobacterales bacterium]
MADGIQDGDTDQLVASGDSTGGETGAPESEAPRGATAPTNPADLERQARELVARLKVRFGGFGDHVNASIKRAASKTRPDDAASSEVSAEDDALARRLARRWIERDPIIDRDLPDGMGIREVTRPTIWRVELMERGETRAPADPSRPAPAGSLWERDFPAAPLSASEVWIESIPGTERTLVCASCGGHGKTACATCDGHGSVQCPKCHGRTTVACPTCLGRRELRGPAVGIGDPLAAGYLALHLAGLSTEAAARATQLGERLRTEYGIPLPPAASWANLDPTSTKPVPCPTCADGTVPCDCGAGFVICETCAGEREVTCAVCKGAGKVAQLSEVARHFDSASSWEMVAPGNEELLKSLPLWLLRRAAGDEVWSGPVSALGGEAPAGVSAEVWEALRHHHQTRPTPAAPQQISGGERRIVDERATVASVPVTLIRYTFDGQPYAVTAVGRTGAERFLAESYPPRWKRVRRFFQALTEDVNAERRSESRPSTLRGVATDGPATSGTRPLPPSEG